MNLKTNPRYKPLDEKAKAEIIRLHKLGYGSSSIPLQMKNWPGGAPLGSTVYTFLKQSGLTRDPKTARSLGCQLRGKQPKAKRGE